MAEKTAKKSRGLTPKARKWILAGGLVFIGCVLAAGLVFGNYLSDNKIPNFRHSTVLYVYPDTGVDEVLQNIVDSCRVVREKSLRRTFESKQVAQYLKPGRYVVEPEHTSAYVARMLNNGWQTPTKLVLSGTLRQKGVIARKISSQLMIDSATVASALDNPELLSKYGFTPQNVFSMIIPDSYEMYWTANITDILDSQKKAYDAFWTPERKKQAEAQGLTQEEVSIVASIVKGESNYEPEFPKIAGVYLNRLRKGMKLQADPTIAFCYDYSINRILKKHLKYESLYNTYLNNGLPPGPICVPTKACLEAVLSPDNHGYLFFCANSNFDGSHLFAVTYDQHLKNARAFQSALNARAKSKKQQ